MAGGSGGGGETAYPVRKALGFTAEQWERVRAFRFGHRFGTEAEAVRRCSTSAWRRWPAACSRPTEGQDQPPSPGRVAPPPDPPAGGATRLATCPGRAQGGAGVAVSRPAAGRMAGRRSASRSVSRDGGAGRPEHLGRAVRADGAGRGARGAGGGREAGRGRPGRRGHGRPGRARRTGQGRGAKGGSGVAPRSEARGRGGPRDVSRRDGLPDADRRSPARGGAARPARAGRGTGPAVVRT
jgi:hypothetical protein